MLEIQQLTPGPTPGKLQMKTSFSGNTKVFTIEFFDCFIGGGPVSFVRLPEEITEILSGNSESLIRLLISVHQGKEVKLPVTYIVDLPEIQDLPADTAVA